MHQTVRADLLGAHVSTQGGVASAPARGTAIGATAIQVFTKTPNQWREPAITMEIQTAFRREVDRSGIASIVAHDSYLINLASPDPALQARSEASFRPSWSVAPLLGIPAVVSHPGNFIDDREDGLAAERGGLHPMPSTRCRAPVMVLLETTAGTGTALGSTFEELAELRDRIGEQVRHRIGVLRRHLPPLLRGL